MVNYTCYRCGYSNINKSNIVRHIARKNSCIPKFNNINLDEVKESILSGLNYEEYLNLNDKPNKYPDSQNIYPDKYPDQSIIYPNKYPNSVENAKNIDNNGEDNICEFCKKILSSYKNLWRHLKTCKEKKKDEEVKDSMDKLVKLLNKKLDDQNKQINNQMNDFKKELTKRDNQLTKRDKQLMKQNKQIDELIKKAGINNSTINVQNNIKLLSYSDTDRSHLTDNDIIKCLKHSNFCIPYLIEKIHFDANKPENHNVYISNLKNKYIMMYDGKKWKCNDRDEQITNLIDDNEGIIEYKLEEWIENGNKFPEMMKKFNRYIEKKENDIVINKIKDDIKLLLYNNRTIINKDVNKLAIVN
jgi:hypothetical protein